MALSKIDVANMLTGATPVANGGTALTSGFVNGKDPRPDAKPLIINGNMAIAQRGASFTSPGDAEYTLDRFNTNKSHDGAVTITQETLSSGNAYTDGFKNALKIDVTTVDTSLGSSQRLLLVQKIEAQNLQLLKFGTSNAKKMTLAFWVKATKTGTNVVRMYAPDDDRSCSISYTISSSNTWEHKVLNFPSDTTGVIDDNNGSGIEIAWGLSAGSGFTSGTLATTWASNTGANDFVGQVNHLDSTSNNFHITGVQLEVGEFSSTTLPPFQHEDFGDNLQRCKRYFETQTGFYFFSFQSGTNVTHNAFINCKVEKRDTPTGTYSGSALNFYPNTGGSNSETNNVTAITIGDKHGSTFLRFESEGGAPTDAGYYPIYADARNAVANWDAEL